MYLNYYHLNKEPFKITCDPEFLWFSEKHKESLADLQYGLEIDRGFVLLTGEVGTGKTLLINKLLTMLPEKTIAASLSGHNLDSMDFYRLLADRLNLPYTFNSKSEFLLDFQNYLHESNNHGQRIVLILDEAQVFEHHVLEDILMLSNIELPDKKLLCIFLVGQPALNQTLLKKENRALVQRITARHQIDALDGDEIASYIRHRLKVAGCSKAIFNKAALIKISDFSRGIPRLINVICDRALLYGSAHKLKCIDANTIAVCIQKLHIPEVKNDSPPSQPQDSDTPRPSPPPKRRRFTRFLYAGIIPAMVFSLTLAFMKFDVQSVLVAIKKDPTVIEQESLVAVPEAEEIPSAVLGWPENKKIPIQFNQANQMSKDAHDAINQVAQQLIQFPEQTISVSSHADSEGPLEHQASLWQQRVDTVKSRLLQKGVRSYQIKLIAMKLHATEAVQEGNPTPYALIGFNDHLNSVVYNQEK